MNVQSYALATLLSDPPDEGAVQHTADAIETMFSGMTDESKADLYAMLAESVYPGQSFAAKEVACAIALKRNKMRFPHG